MPRNNTRIRALAVTSAALAAVLLGACAPAEQVSDTAASSTLSAPVPTLPAFTPTTTSPSPKEQATDFSRLLLTADDISDHEDTFAQRSSTPDADGLPGASVFFVNVEDTRAITDTIVVYPSPEEATAALQQVVADPARVVSGGAPQPVLVGSDGTMIKGTSPAGDRAVTLLLYTQDRALVRLRFESAIGDATTDPFVTKIGKMQQIALRTGLTDQQ